MSIHGAVLMGTLAGGPKGGVLSMKVATCASGCPVAKNVSSSRVG